MRSRIFNRFCGAGLLASVGILASAGAANGAVVINEIYALSGGSGASYKNDYIELLNNSNAATQSISGWHVEYWFASGTSFNTKINIPTGVSLLPGQSFLIQCASGGTNGASLPTPDLTSSVDINQAGAKIFLTDAANASQDFLGFGSANDAEPTSANRASAITSGTQSLSRTNGVDTNVNSADFSLVAPTPTATPEPGSLAVMGGAAGLLMLRRKRA